VRRRSHPTAGLREQLAERMRASSLGVIARLFDDVADNPTQADARRHRSWDARIDQLERGEPVEVANWELPRGTLPVGSCQPGQPYWYVVDPDGVVLPAVTSDSLGTI
jgi:hypothetical protein